MWWGKSRQRTYSQVSTLSSLYFITLRFSCRANVQSRRWTVLGGPRCTMQVWIHNHAIITIIATHETSSSPCYPSEASRCSELDQGCCILHTTNVLFDSASCVLDASLSDACIGVLICSSAASGSAQTVQLLCEHRSPVNLRDAVCTPAPAHAVRHAAARVLKDFQA